MRLGNEAEFLYNQDEFVGINLGADFCSEHEWGITPIKAAFGIVDKPSEGLVGFDARTITNTSARLVYTNTEKGEYLVFNFSFYDGETVDDFFARYSHRAYKYNLVGLWGENSFAIQNTKEDKLLKKLYDAFQKLDIVIFLGRSGPFQNGGLKICIASLIPEDARKEAEERDLSYMRLQKASETTGILQRLREAQKEKVGTWQRKCGYFACKPHWKPENGKFDTAYPVIYWLNPEQQHLYSSGWYTVEQLDEWIEGKGPVIIKS